MLETALTGLLVVVETQIEGALCVRDCIDRSPCCCTDPDRRCFMC